MKAVQFSLPDQNGKIHTLVQYVGQWLVLYFYPKDDTPGCTKEACSFRDAQVELVKQGIMVLGVSKDSVRSHKKFIEKYSLPFTLLSDPDHVVTEAYGAWGLKKFMGRDFEGILRKTFIISPKGEIVKEYPAVTPDGHAQEILKDLKEFKK